MIKALTEDSRLVEKGSVNMITIRSVLLVVMVVLAGACAQLLMKVGINSKFSVQFGI